VSLEQTVTKIIRPLVGASMTSLRACGRTVVIQLHYKGHDIEHQVEDLAAVVDNFLDLGFEFCGTCFQYKPSAVGTIALTRDIILRAPGSDASAG
jgi:hypothetical protein